MSYPGLILPTTNSYTIGTGNARDSSMVLNQNMNEKQASLANAVGGKRRRKYRGGATVVPANADSVVIPQYQMLYPVQNGPGTTPNNQIAGLSSTGMQSASWSANDSKAAIKGGSKRRYKRGGNPDWVWGCFSGGRKTKYRRTRRSTKKRKTRRHHRH